MAEPFFWGGAGQKLSPAQAAARRRIADQMLSSTTAATTLGGGLAKVGDALKGIYYDKQASDAEAAGASERKAVLDALMGNSDPSMGDLYGAMGNEWVSSDPASMAVIQAMMGQEMQQNDPLRQLQIQQAQQGLDKGSIELEQLRNPPPPAPEFGWETMPDGTLIRTDKTSGEVTPMGQFAQGEDPTSAIQNYEYLIESGIDPVKAQDMAFGGGGTTINNMGNIPPGYAVQYDENGRPASMSPVPGSPAALEAQAAADKAAMVQERQGTSTDTITDAAATARDLASQGGTTGVMGVIQGFNPESNAAELRRQTSVLTSIATIENLNQMRQSSPTGGALGNVTEGEGRMLAAAAGALDPNASPEQYKRALDNYERTLLRIVHGQAEGDRIFEQTRQSGTGGQTTVDPNDIDALLELYKDQ